MFPQEYIVVDARLLQKIPTVPAVVLSELQKASAFTSNKTNAHVFIKQLAERLNYNEGYYNTSIQMLLDKNLVRIDGDDIIVNGAMLSTVLSGTVYNKDISSYYIQAAPVVEVIEPTGPIIGNSGVRVTEAMLLGFGFPAEKAKVFMVEKNDKMVTLKDIMFDLFFETSVVTPVSVAPTPIIIEAIVEEPIEAPAPVIVAPAPMVTLPGPTTADSPTPTLIFTPAVLQEEIPTVVAQAAPVVMGGPFSQAANIAAFDAAVVTPVVAAIVEPAVATNASPADVASSIAVVTEEPVMKKERKKKEKSEIVPKPPRDIHEVYEWVEKHYTGTIVPSGDFRYTLDDYLSRAETAFNNYAAAENPWHDSQGTPIQNWKVKIIQNWFAKMVKAPFGYRPLNYVPDASADPNAAENHILHVKNEKGLDKMNIAELRLFVEHPKADFAGKAAANAKLSGAIAYKNSDILGFGNGTLDLLSLSKTRIDQLLEWSDGPNCEPHERVKLRSALSMD